MNSELFPTRPRCGRGATPRGFTLIELMIAMVVVSVLAAIAFPAYNSSVRKARRADASDGAVAVMQAQERWRANKATYTADLASLNVPASTTNGLYTMTLSGNTATAYTVGFTPVAGKGQTNDTGCNATTVTVTMTVTVTAGSPVYAPPGCWSR